VLRSARGARLAAGSDPAGLRAAFAGGLEAILESREAALVFLRFRRDPGPLGEVFRGLVERALDELHTDMVSLGLVPAADPWGRRLALYTVSLCLGAAEALLDGDADDVEQVADDLGRVAAMALGAR